MVACLCVVLAPGTNSTAALVLAAIVAAGGVMLADFVVWSGVARKWRSLWALRLATALLLGLATGPCFTLTKGVAFARAFGTEVPSGATRIAVEGHYVTGIPGGAGDLVIFIQFEATADDLQKLLSHRPFERDHELEQQWTDPNLGSAFVWKTLFGGMAETLAGKAWLHPPVTEDVEIYRWGEASPTTLVLWDASAGRAYVLFTLG